MQFRELGQWIELMAHPDPKRTYVLFCSETKVVEVTRRLERNGLSDRFEVRGVVDRQRIETDVYVYLTQRGQRDVFSLARVWSIYSLMDAFAVAETFGLKDQLLAEAVEAMEQDRPYRVRFEGTERPEEDGDPETEAG